MFDHSALALAAAVLVFASFLQGFSGFGMNLIAVGILAHMANVHSVVPLCMTLACTSSLFLLWQNRRSVRLRPLLPIIPPALLGVPFGVEMLSRLDSVWAMRLLGTTLILISAAQVLTSRSDIWSPKPWKASIAGFLGGLLGGAFGTAGPPLATYFHFTTDSLTARTSLYTMFGFIGLFSVTGHIIAGNANAAVAKSYLILLPAVMLGSTLGGLTAARTDPTRYKRFIVALLTLLGISLLIR